MTREDIMEYCKRFKVGDRVLINVMKRDDEGKRARIEKVEGTILQRYPHSILVDKSGLKESFSYTDIALFGVIEKKRGRKPGEAKRVC